MTRSAAPDGLLSAEQFVPTRDGWSLGMRRSWWPERFDPASRPILLVPGYGMNTFILGYHPAGTSLEHALAAAGFEVWSVNLRGQGPSEAVEPGAPGPSLRRYAEVDLPAAIDRVLSATRSSARDLVLIGCSLGGSIAYAHLALGDGAARARVGALVAMGAPLRWVETHPFVRLAFGSPAVAGAVRIERTRAIVRGLVPVLRRFPRLLALYMNAASIDLDHIEEMTRTVEDPHPGVNREIAEWIRDTDLRLDGVNVSEALRELDLPLLVVTANRDGIVPPATALSVLDRWGARDVEVLSCGDERDWYAHANLFVARDAPTRVFAPLVRWLRRVQAG
jgi:pimeloyl-ACP methyl ester carboxylesterase